MLDYIHRLQGAIQELNEQATELYEAALVFPKGDERDRLTREWCRRRGEARGYEMALLMLGQHLGKYQEALAE